jgi:hypothetical protein
LDYWANNNTVNGGTGWIPTVYNNDLWTGAYQLGAFYANYIFSAKGIKLKNTGFTNILSWLNSDANILSGLAPQIGMIYTSLTSLAMTFSIDSSMTNGFIFTGGVLNANNGIATTSLTSSSTITSTGLVTANGGIYSTDIVSVTYPKTPKINLNLQPHATSPLICENVERFLCTTLANQTLGNRFYFSTIYLVQGMVINGISVFLNISTPVAAACLLRPAIWSSAGAVLAQGNSVSTGTSTGAGGATTFTLYKTPLTSAYTVPSSGLYFIGYNFNGNTATNSVLGATPAANSYMFSYPVLNTATTTVLSQVSMGWAVASSALIAPISGLTYTTMNSIGWLGLY